MAKYIDSVEVKLKMWARYGNKAPQKIFYGETAWMMEKE
jgi:hypothetical protein